jgi:hypothetical protein
MRVKEFQFLAAVVLMLPSFASLPGWSQSSPAQKIPGNGGVLNPGSKVPEGAILVKGAWASANDSVTPLPEGSSVKNGVFRDAYFGMSYTLTPGWVKSYDGPPPSDSGRYVVAQLRFLSPNKTDSNNKNTAETPSQASILITAQDMFFTRLPANNALQFVNYMKNNLPADYKLEEVPAPTEIGGRRFTFYAYWSPVAELHWYVLATEIRCHTVEIVLTSRDTKMLGNLVLDLSKMTLPADTNPTAGAGGGAFPVCVKDYARDENLTARVDPVFTEHRANPVPVRIIIDKNGRVKHIHFLSAFPDQVKAITDVLGRWKFKPYVKDGHPVEVETGIMFGRAAAAATPRGSSVE